MNHPFPGIKIIEPAIIQEYSLPGSQMEYQLYRKLEEEKWKRKILLKI